MRTLAIQYPDPWGKSAIPNKENSPLCPGLGEVGANIDRCINDSTAIEPYQFEPEDSASVDGQDDSLDLGNQSADANPQNDPRLGNTHW